MTTYGVAIYGVDGYNATDFIVNLTGGRIYIGCQLNDGNEANGTFDELQIFSVDKSDTEISAYFTTTIANTWSQGVDLIAHFDNNLEGGNLFVENLDITEWRIYKKLSTSNLYKYLKSIPNDASISNIVTSDYEVGNGVLYDYAIEGVTVLGESSLKFESTNKKLKFDGISLINTATGETFQFRYNLGDVSIDIETDRSEVKTLSEFPLIRRGRYKARKGSITCALVSTDPFILLQQLNVLERMLNVDTLVLKVDTGDIFPVSVYNINYTRHPETLEIINLKCEFTQTGSIVGHSADDFVD